VAECRSGAAPTIKPAPAPRAAAPPAQPAPTRGAARSMAAGKFSTEAQAKAHCPGDTVAWANTASKIYHFSGTGATATRKLGPTCARRTPRPPAFEQRKTKNIRKGLGGRGNGRLRKAAPVRRTAIESFRLIETGDVAAAERTIAADFINWAMRIRRRPTRRTSGRPAGHTFFPGRSRRQCVFCHEPKKPLAIYTDQGGRVCNQASVGLRCKRIDARIPPWWGGLT